VKTTFSCTPNGHGFFAEDGLSLRVNQPSISIGAQVDLQGFLPKIFGKQLAGTWTLGKACPRVARPHSKGSSGRGFVLRRGDGVS
jgi:hypothetical protein